MSLRPLEDVLEYAESLGFDREEVSRRIQKKYAVYLEEENFVKLRELYDATGIKPSDDIVQKKYVAYIKEGRVDDSITFHSITRLKPNLSEDVVQEAYAACAREGRLPLLRDFQELTGIKPNLSDDVLKKEYASYIEKAYEPLKQKKSSSCKEPRFSPFFLQDWSEEGVQKKYVECVRERDIEQLIYLYEETGIKPNLSEDVVQEAYAACVKEGGWLPSLRDFQELTGIKPSKDVYKAFIESL